MNTKELAKTLRLCLLAVALAACAGNFRPVSEVRANAVEISPVEMQLAQGTQVLAANSNRY